MRSDECCGRIVCMSVVSLPACARSASARRSSRSRSRRERSSSSRRSKHSSDRDRDRDRDGGGWKPRSKGSSSNFDVKPPEGTVLPGVGAASMGGALPGMMPLGNGGGVSNARRIFSVCVVTLHVCCDRPRSCR